MGDKNRLFLQFEANLRMTPATVSAVRNRYHAITRRINVDFWGMAINGQYIIRIIRKYITLLEGKIHRIVYIKCLR